jgi:hypothetical protein
MGSLFVMTSSATRLQIREVIATAKITTPEQAD